MSSDPIFGLNRKFSLLCLLRQCLTICYCYSSSERIHIFVFTASYLLSICISISFWANFSFRFVCGRTVWHFVK